MKAHASLYRKYMKCQEVFNREYYIDNEGKYLEIQWFGPGNDDGSAVFESDHPLSVDELLAAMNVR